MEMQDQPTIKQTPVQSDVNRIDDIQAALRGPHSDLYHLEYLAGRLRMAKLLQCGPLEGLEVKGLLVTE